MYKEKVNFEKLKDYGFVFKNGIYQYQTDIMGDQLTLFVLINLDGELSTSLIDNQSQEEYVLHLMETATGKFVGNIRAEYDAVLDKIKEECFEIEVFKSKQSKEIIEYVRIKYGDGLEYLWEKFPNNAIWRRSDNKKWYGILIDLPKKKLGLNEEGNFEIIDLRIDTNELKDVVDNVNFFEAYHMNKHHWFTIRLDGKVTTDEICKWLDKSYILALKK